MYKDDSNLKKKRRSQIVDNAKILFKQKGIVNTNMQEIAEISGVGRSTMYEYFASKEDLLLYVRELYLKEMYCFDYEIHTDMSGIEQLEFILNKYFDLMLEKPNAMIFFMELNRYFTTTNEIFKNFPHYSSHVSLVNAILKGKLDQTLFHEDVEQRIAIIVQTLIATATRFAVRDAYSYESDQINKGNMMKISKDEIKVLIRMLLYGINTVK